MKNKNNLIENIIAWSLPLIFIAVIFLIFIMQPRTQKLRQTAVEPESETQPQIQIETEAETEKAVREVLPENERVSELLAGMTLEEKVAQLFIITPEALTGVDQVFAAGEKTRSAYDTYPVGGMVYFESNLESEYQLRTMLTDMEQISTARIGIPAFLSVDEEGDRVARIANHGAFPVDRVQSALAIGTSGESDQAFATGVYIGSYLADLGFNLDYAPVADVIDSADNAVVGSRSFGTDPDIASDMVAAAVEGFKSQEMLTTLKHFPGHGATAEDSHVSFAYNNKTEEELRACEFIPFQAGIEAGADMVMVGHISLPNVTGGEEPASLSKKIITDILREELGYNGIVITDAMNMGAISENYDPGEAAVAAILAGVDIVLMPSDFKSAYESVLTAVQSGQISESRIDESLVRILNVKINL